MRVIFAFLFLVALTVFTACSTKKNTLVNRSYHNLTAKYNIFFNGNQSYKEAIRKIETNWRDDYSAILPLTKYGNKDLNKSVDNEMDVTIKKSTKLIKTHSITAKPKKSPGVQSKRQQEFYKKTDYCNWVDNSYLLIGKANFIKSELPMAISTFNLVVEKYPNELEKYEAQIWLVRSYIESGKYGDARELLTLLATDKKMPEKTLHEIHLLNADLLIREKKYSDAKVPLQKVIEKEKKRKLKLRYIYIMAQLHLATGNRNEAYELFKNVEKRNSDYNMVFNARINQALAFSGDASMQNSIQKQLDKLLADEKNVDLKDQIYFAKAKLAEQKSDMPQAIELYKQAAGAAKPESNYKALSYLALADYYFNQRIYISAGNYYDSTMMVLPKTYTEYNVVETKAAGLLTLIKKLQIIEREDSLRRVARMPESEQNKIIEKLIQEVVLQEQAELQKQQNLNANNYSGNENRMDPTGAGKWYFYNPTTVSFGMAEFKKKWGDRKLEDHWRRRNKNTVLAETNTSDENEQDAKNGNSKFTNKDKGYYKLNLPVSDSSFMESENKSATALYEAAMIYKDQIKSYTDAIKLFEKFDNNFSSHSLHPDVLYQWYLTYNLMGNSESANQIQDRLVDKYPDSHYAKLLTKPGYLNELKENEQQLANMYELAYQQMIAQNYSESLSIINQVRNKTKGHRLEPKYKLLEALSYGGVGNGVKYVQSLEQIVIDFPQTPESQKAMDMLSALQNSAANNTNESNNLVRTQMAKAEEIYKLEMEAQHWVVFLPKNEMFDANKVLFQAVVFNANNYTGQNLEVISEGKEQNEQFKAVVIKSFPDGATALKYYNKIILDAEIKSISSLFNLIVVSQTNYAKLPSDPEQNLYRIFFEKYYLRK